MIIEEIARVFMYKGRTPEDCALRMALIYTLYKDGYKVPHITSALSVHRASVTFACRKVQDMISIGDPLVTSLLEKLQEHSIRLVPYFEKIGGLYKTKAHIEVDNVKLIY